MPSFGIEVHQTQLIKVKSSSGFFGQNQAQISQLTKNCLFDPLNFVFQSILNKSLHYEENAIGTAAPSSGLVTSRIVIICTGSDILMESWNSF